MKRVPGFLRFFLWSLIVIVALGGALFGYFVYSPAPEVPRLSGTLTQGTIEVGGRTRTYLSYVPLGLTKGAPLVVVMHGSGQTVRKCESGQGMGSSALRTKEASRHSSALLALSAIIRPSAQITERTGSDLGLLRATAAMNRYRHEWRVTFKCSAYLGFIIVPSKGDAR